MSENEIQKLREEIKRLEKEVSDPRCHECEAALGDNWCADCATKALSKPSNLKEKERAESGPIRFGNDWRGLFLRGDEAMAYALLLRTVLERPVFESFFEKPVLTGLLETLESVHEASKIQAQDLKPFEECKL